MNNLFNSNYSLEELIQHFVKDSCETFYLDIDSGDILTDSLQDSANLIAFKPISKNTLLNDLKISSDLSVSDLINKSNTHQRAVYNYVKDKAIDFLSENKILPPSLNPILTFKENAAKAKIKIEIN